MVYLAKTTDRQIQTHRDKTQTKASWPLCFLQLAVRIIVGNRRWSHLKTFTSRPHCTALCWSPEATRMCQLLFCVNEKTHFVLIFVSEDKLCPSRSMPSPLLTMTAVRIWATFSRRSHSLPLCAHLTLTVVWADRRKHALMQHNIKAQRLF